MLLQSEFCGTLSNGCFECSTARNLTHYCAFNESVLISSPFPRDESYAPQR